jgi:hypothetical protein
VAGGRKPGNPVSERYGPQGVRATTPSAATERCLFGPDVVGMSGAHPLCAAHARQ